IIFFSFVQHFRSAAQQKYGQVAFPCLQRYIFHLFFAALPWLVFYRQRDSIARTGFDNIALLYFFLFLYARWQVQTAFSTFIRFGGADQYAVSDNNQFLELIVWC